MERVGICHHMGRISPVFDVANNLRVFEIAQEWRREVAEKVLVGGSAFTRAQEISGLGIKTVICGAISRPLQQALRACGVDVISFVCGTIDEVVRAFAEGRLHDERFLMPGCCGKAQSLNNHKSEGNFENQIKRGPLKVAVASSDGTMEGMVDERFGRCKKLVLYTPQSDSIEVIDNEANTRAADSSGIATAQAAIRAGAHAVISGDYGPKAVRVLRAAGLDVYSTPQNGGAIR